MVAEAASRGNGTISVEKVAIIIQFPPFVRSFDPEENFGKAQYDESTKVCRWEIGTLVPERSSTGSMERFQFMRWRVSG